MLQLNYRCCLSFILQSYLGILKLQYIHRKLHTYQPYLLYYGFYDSGACPGIRKGGGAKSESVFFLFVCFLLFNFSGGGGLYAAHKIAEKMIFSTKKVAKYS